MKRSAIMRAVKSRDTLPERAVRKLLSASGYRYRLHSKHLPGCPDIVFAGRKKAIFINGCFWHGHPCKRGARTPKTNVSYWRSKIERNQLRDKHNIKMLRKAGWKIKIVWECELKNETLKKLLKRFLGPP